MRLQFTPFISCMTCLQAGAVDVPALADAIAGKAGEPPAAHLLAQGQRCTKRCVFTRRCVEFGFVSLMSFEASSWT